MVCVGLSWYRRPPRTWTDSPSREIRFSLPQVDAYGGAHGLAFVDQFLDATVDESVEMPADGMDALRVARVIEAAYTSNHTGQHIELIDA